jgi:hypothetical protein
MTLGGGRGNFFLPFTIHKFNFLITTSPFISPLGHFLLAYLSFQTRNGMRKKGFVVRKCMITKLIAVYDTVTQMMPRSVEGTNHGRSPTLFVIVLFGSKLLLLVTPQK